MEVKPGYRNTEVGMIPEDWRVKPLFSLSTEIGDGIHSTPNYVKSSEFYFVNGNNLVNDRISITDSTMSVSESEYQTLRKNLTDRTLLLSINGTIGNLAFYRGEHVVLGKSAAYINVANNVSRTFISYCLKSRPTSLFFDNELTGTTIRNLSLQSLRNTPVPLPPTIEEQRAIAGALSDVDALIGALDQLIAKKRDLKQGAMQQLLTGQTRLPGFHGEWEKKHLGELGQISGAGVDKKTRPDEALVRLVNYMDVYRRNVIYSKDLSHVVSAPPEQAARCAVKRGDVFFTPSSEMPFDIALSAVAMEDIPDAVYSYHVVRLRLGGGWDLLFRGYAFRSQEFLRQAARACEGSGVRYVITQGRFRQLSVRFPPTKEEQAAIGVALSDMDAELAALEQRRAKTRALKQGMMQELLTGRARLR
jgi:type I restriction enzyme, S subunit